MPLTTFTDADISKCREIIISGLGGEPVDVDDLIAWCDQPSAVVLVAILELELAGRLTSHCGNRVSRQFEFWWLGVKRQLQIPAVNQACN